MFIRQYFVESIPKPWRKLKILATYDNMRLQELSVRKVDANMERISLDFDPSADAYDLMFKDLVELLQPARNEIIERVIIEMTSEEICEIHVA